MIDFPLNPWLGEVVQSHREFCGDECLRDSYKTLCDNDGNLSWPEFLTKRALEVHLNKNPFLRKPLELLPLSRKAKDILYWTGVDRVSDLLQITREELAAIGADDDDVSQYLKDIGLEPLSYPGRTTKLSLSYGYWTIPSPGATHVFNIGRPTLREEWFEEYYRHYGHFEDEEIHRYAFDAVMPVCLEDGFLPNDYREFFRAANFLFDSYAECCKCCEIEPMVKRPMIPSPDVRFIYREALRAVIDIFERTSLLKKASVADYLGTPLDERRLNIAEAEGHNQDFQLFLINHVEIKIDIENIGLTLEECLRGMHGNDFAVRPKPGGHPFADAILRMREKVSDDELRERYRKALEENPDLSWDEFIVMSA